MKEPIVETRGLRIFIQTYGDKRLIAALKELTPRPKWESDAKEWSLPVASLEAVRKVIEDWKDAPADAEPAKVKEDPNKITLVGKCLYKGRSYFVRRIFDADTPPKAWLVSFDGSISFKVALDLIEVTKRYEPRSVGYGRFARQEFMTLGKIQRFVADQKAGKGPSGGRCPECDSWVRDGESCRNCGGC